MKLLIQLVREILHLSGKSQGISETPSCGNHDRETKPVALGKNSELSHVCLSGKNCPW